ncbi:BamA/TamA family outer membrane protein, partial [Streptococcus pneumoniae]
NMAIARAGISGVYSFGDNAYGSNRAHQMTGGIQVGYIWSDNFNHVPYRLRFFAGGDQSIRGYAHDSLSPISD